MYIDVSITPIRLFTGWGLFINNPQQINHAGRLGPFASSEVVPQILTVLYVETPGDLRRIV